MVYFISFLDAGDLSQTSVPTSLQWRLNHHLSTALDSTVLPPSSSVTSSTKDSEVSYYVHILHSCLRLRYVFIKMNLRKCWDSHHDNGSLTRALSS